MQPGQEGGAAIADILFGDADPGGRLPVTFYRSVDDLPDFRDYGMAGRTYRFFNGEVLYPFGHGLSYTTFEYSDVARASDRIEVTVTNTGKRHGEEVVQVYDDNALVGFRRVSLKPGESRRVVVKVATPTTAQPRAPSRTLGLFQAILPIAPKP